MASVPSELRYTKEHEWVRVEGGLVVVGITEYAADALGDVVYVELPAVGRSLAQAETFGVVESVKAVSDLYTPIAGEVVQINPALAQTPELVNSDPYGVAWMLKLRVADLAVVEKLLDASAYEAFTKED